MVFPQDKTDIVIHHGKLATQSLRGLSLQNPSRKPWEWDHNMFIIFTLELAMPPSDLLPEGKFYVNFSNKASPLLSPPPFTYRFQPCLEGVENGVRMKPT